MQEYEIRSDDFQNHTMTVHGAIQLSESRGYAIRKWISANLVIPMAIKLFYVAGMLLGMKTDIEISVSDDG